MSAAEVLAEALRRDGWTCEYHEPEDRGVCGGCDEAHDRTAARQVDALKAAGYEVVELPTSSEHNDNGDREWSAMSAWSARVFADDPRRVHVWDSAHPWNTLPEPVMPQKARSLAAALLAAANDAEASSEVAR